MAKKKAQPTIEEQAKEFLNRLDVTTATLYRKDRKRLETLRLKHSFKVGEEVRVQDFFTIVIDFYEKHGR